jgi:hypothetical protein
LYRYLLMSMLTLPVSPSRVVPGKAGTLFAVRGDQAPVVAAKLIDQISRHQ